MDDVFALLIEQGKHEKAKQEALGALRINPRLPDAYVCLAAVATACQDHEGALEQLSQLMQFAPNHVEGLVAKAMSLLHLDRLNEALETAYHAVAVDPNANNSLGAVLQRSGRIEEARAAYEVAAAIPGAGTEKAMISIGRLLMENGEVEEAQTAFERVISAFPHSTDGWYQYAQLKTFEHGDPAIARMVELSASKELKRPAQHTLIHFALGKAYLDIGDSDAAFTHLNFANKTKRASVDYDSDADIKWIDSIRNTFTAEIMGRLSGGGVECDAPVFVVGMPRSGTTLVEQILGSHSQVHAGGELRYLYRIAKSAGSFPSAIPNLDRSQMVDFGETYLNNVVPLLGDRRYLVDKMPYNFLCAGLIQLCLPNARIIHCRRNAVDTCLSCYSRLFVEGQLFSYDMRELGAFYRAYQLLMAHWRMVLSPRRFIEVNYETMVDDTAGQARRLLNFLELSWEDRVLEFYRTQRPVRTASANQVRQPPYRTSVGRWRPHAKHLEPLLDALGSIDQK